ncbi:MAG: peroxiredoxin [Flavobacterium sp. BFFFF1]|uniref:TlpA disulfide reductase family protein n=1 Tax=unclassified Flavobacterium TaxID=196869 RepID=UPI000BC97B79|nr:MULTISPECIES: TlpA disulfide reductase family protein [unclassified Flavobacterium]OYU80647.1 MAG: peroxiredoxin [Flavobacterium sp. BFFFF1]
MKKVSLIILMAIGLVSFTAWIGADFTITGTAAGVENGKKVYLQKQDEKKPGTFITLDSAKVENGKFTLKGKTEEPEIHFLQVDKAEGKVVFILEGGKINFTIYKDSIGKSKVGGTRSNDDLQSFNGAAMKIQDKLMKFQEANTAKWNEANEKNDTIVKDQLIQEVKGYQDQMVALSSNFPEKNPKSFLSVLFIDNMFNNPEVDIEKIKKVFNSLDAPLKETKTGKLIQSKISNYRALTAGNEAPDFSAPTPDGKTASLKGSLGKVTIIDFWASWCGPCRKENPNVVKLYNDYHAKGLNIISVSLDKDGTKWKEAIAKDNLTWTHISNLQFWEDPIAVMYNIKSIPATFVLDEKGKIVAKDLRGEELRAKIASLLDK